jgi:hypothetical protein
MEKVAERPALMPPPGGTLSALTSWATSISIVLVGMLGQLGYRLNRTIPADGTERMTGPLPLMTYTVATRPAVSTANTGALIYVSDAAAGNKLQYSDGNYAATHHESALFPSH